MIGPEYSSATLRMLHGSSVVLSRPLSMQPSLATSDAPESVTCAGTCATNVRLVDLPRWTGNVIVKVITAWSCGTLGTSGLAERLGSTFGFAKGELT